MIVSDGYTMTIGGKSATSARTLDVINPATEKVIAQAPNADKAQLDLAISAGRSALPQWRALSISQRSGFLVSFADKLQDCATELAELLTSEQGKPIAEAQGEIQRSIQWIREIAGYRLEDEIIESSDSREIRVCHVPIGVVAGIAPWNFPVTLAVWKIAPALLAGNTMVLKPSPFTPLTALKLGELARGILPDGVLNVVSGDDELGPWLTAHPGVDKIAFTGSTPTGKAIMKSAADTLKRITLELGGNDAAIVFPDVDVKVVAPKIFWAAFRNNAQFCLASKRVYVHTDIYDDLVRELVAYAGSVRMGNGMEPGVEIGPVQNKRQFDHVRRVLEESHAQGVRFLAGGTVPAGIGYFVPVAIADNPPDDARIVKEEVFGPVLPLLRFSDTDEVVRRVNDTPYGLGGSVWSADLELARSVASRLNSGTLWINTIHELFPKVPFGGHKESGVGVENGMAGLKEYTLRQVLVTNRQPHAVVANNG